MLIGTFCLRGASLHPSQFECLRRETAVITTGIQTRRVIPAPRSQRLSRSVDDFNLFFCRDAIVHHHRRALKIGEELSGSWCMSPFAACVVFIVLILLSSQGKSHHKTVIHPLCHSFPTEESRRIIARIPPECSSTWRASSHPPPHAPHDGATNESCKNVESCQNDK